MRADGLVVPKADVESVEIAAAADLPIVALVETRWASWMERRSPPTPPSTS